jgi:protein TonB
MNRYIGSFFITIWFYALLGLSIFYLFFDEKITLKHMKETTKIQISVISQTQEAKPKIEPIKEEPKEKVKKEKTAKKQESKSVEKIVKKEIKKVQNIKPLKREAEENFVQKKPEKEETIVVKKEPLAKKVVQAVEDKKEAQKEMLLALKELIEKNKFYPPFARKANIQGSVKVCFTLSKEGKLLSFQIKEGKKIFYRSAENAIKKSLPYPIQEDILTSNLTIDLEIVYTLI